MSAKGPFVRSAAFGNMGSNLPFAAVCNADKALFRYACTNACFKEDISLPCENPFSAFRQRAGLLE
jgi:hypothetical protein